MTPRLPGGGSTAVLLDAALVLGLAAYNVAGAATPLPGESGAVTGAWPATVAGLAALALLPRRRVPTAGLAVVLGLCLYAGAADHQMGSTPVALLLAAHAVGRWARRRVAVAAVVALVLVLAVAAFAGAAGISGESAAWGLPLVFAAPWGLGWWGRLREERHHVELRRAADDERRHIARELHDVVTHALTGIAVQAGVARHLGVGQDDALAAVERTSREALDDLRRMVAVLRDPEPREASWRPAPDADDLRRAVTGHGCGGRTTQVEVDDAFDTLPPSLRLAALRLVQESLTNVARHAPDAATWVAVTMADGAMVVAVRDDGESRPSGSPGHGLVGMRERVAAFDGTLRAGLLPTGGFEVRATLPVSVDA